MLHSYTSHGEKEGSEKAEISFGILKWSLEQYYVAKDSSPNERKFWNCGELGKQYSYSLR